MRSENRSLFGTTMVEGSPESDYTNVQVKEFMQRSKSLLAHKNHFKFAQVSMVSRMDLRSRLREDYSR